MVTGIALVGTITAAVAAWFVNIVRTASTTETDDAAEQERAELPAELRTLRESVESLREEVRAANA